jgi:hypothetical protein
LQKVHATYKQSPFKFSGMYEEDVMKEAVALECEYDVSTDILSITPNIKRYCSL